MARLHRRGERKMRDLERASRVGLVSIPQEVNPCAQSPCALAQELDVAQKHEARWPATLGEPNADIGADTGRLAHRDRERGSKGHRVACWLALSSTVAHRCLQRRQRS